MGELVLAAKITHVPSIWLSMKTEKYRGIRASAEAGLREIGRRARDRGADVFVICDTHWLNSMGFHVNGRARFDGSYASHELPHFIHDLAYSYPGDPEFAQLFVDEINAGGQRAMLHDYKDLGLEYGTLVPMSLIQEEGVVDVQDRIPIVPIGANMFTQPHENRLIGEALRRAIAKSDRNVAVLASGSLSHQFPPNEISYEYLDRISEPLNTAVDLDVLEMWKSGRITEFLDVLPEFNRRFSGEGSMADTGVLFGVLGWDAYTGHGEQLCEYFPSSGTGQVVVDFSLDGVPELTP